MRTPAQLRRDLQAILADLPRVLAQDLTAEERREYKRAGRQARLRLFWMRERVVPVVQITGDTSLFEACEREQTRAFGVCSLPPRLEFSRSLSVCEPRS